MRRRNWAIVVSAMLGSMGAACGGSGKTRSAHEPIPPPPPPPPPDTSPVTRGDWTYYGGLQGLSADVHDVSADEGGNVYVAGGDAVYAKARGAKEFLRFDAAAAGLTVNCNDYAQRNQPVPTAPDWMCPVISVGGAAAGKAIIGFAGFPNDPALPGYDWVLATGGADVVSFDAAAGTLGRVRHVNIGSPPHTICGHGGEERGTTCAPDEYYWNNGRRMFHKVDRIVVNHDPASPMYGDAWMCGEHATFAVLLQNAAARGYLDRTAGYGEPFTEMKDVWEHLHPALNTPSHPEWFVNGECTAMSINPVDGKPWASNRFRTTHVEGYGGDLSGDHWFMGTQLDVWPDPSPEDLASNYDDVSSMSHCADGTLWIGSRQHGLARIGPGGDIGYLSLPDASLGNAVSAVACDPLDQSLWIGFSTGGVMRLANGAFQKVDATGLPAFAHHPVESIQVDRWASPRIVYFAFSQVQGADGVVEAGGVGAYAGP